MTKNEIIQQIKNEALNEIRKIYNPKYKFPFDQYDRESSYTEQIEYKIRYTIESMEKRIKETKRKFKPIQNEKIN